MERLSSTKISPTKKPTGFQLIFDFKIDLNPKIQYQNPMKKSKKLTSSKAPKNTRKAVTYPRLAGDAFVSQKMLYSVRDEMISHTEMKFQETEVRFDEVKAEINGVKAEIHGLKAEIHGVKAEINGVKAEINGVKAEINGLKAEIHGVKAEIHEVKATIARIEKSSHRMELLLEEQNNRNKIVLDGLSHLFERQERIEKKMNTTL
jgi:archaellum component FlaC